MMSLRQVLFCLLAVLLGCSAPGARADSYVFDGRAIPTCFLSNKSYTCPAAPLDATDSVTIASGYTVNVNSSVTAKYSNAVIMSSGARLVVNGSLDVSDVAAANMRIGGGAIVVAGAFSAGDQKQTIAADITAGSMKLGGGSTLSISGNLVASGTIALGSHVTVNGALVAASISTGTPVLINGSVTATGAFTLSSNSIVNGDVDVATLTLEDANARINGNANVNSAILGWHAVVTDFIGCKKGTAPGKCDCVTNNSGYPVNSTDGPTCQIPDTGPDHFQIDHGGTGLTCQPQAIKISACADAACSALYTGGASVVVLPGPITVNVDTTGVNAAVMVSRTSAGVATLFAGSGTVCRNTVASSASCQMQFVDAAFILSGVPDHVAGSAQSLQIQAVKKGAPNQACVAAFAGTTQTIAFKCSTLNPAAGSTSVVLAGQACSSTPSTRAVSFSGSTASLALVSNDVGDVQVQADLADPAMTGADTFIAAPSRFSLNTPTTFIAGVPMPVIVSALNSNGALTQNFGKESVPALPKLAHTFCAPAGGAQGSMTSAMTSLVNGVARFDVAYSEVGRIDISAQSTNYLGSGLSVNGASHTGTSCAGGGSYGPFVAHHLAIEATPATTRSWYYAGEPVPVTVSAQNLANQVTLNYDSKYSLSKAVALSTRDSNAASTTGPGTLVTVPGFSPTLTIPATSFSAGVARLSLAYYFSAAKTAPYALVVRADDADTAKLALPVSKTMDYTPQIRSGRLRLASRFGAARMNLDIPVVAEVWTGGFWQLNADDSFSTLPATSIGLSPPAGMTGLKLLSGGFTLNAGTGVIKLQAPSAGAGTVGVTLNLGAASASTDISCLAVHPPSSGALLPYLRTANAGCNPTNIADPSARATFGAFGHEAKRIIHTREVFN